MHSLVEDQDKYLVLDIYLAGVNKIYDLISPRLHLSDNSSSYYLQATLEQKFTDDNSTN